MNESKKVIKDVKELISFVNCVRKFDFKNYHLRSKILFAIHCLIISEDEDLSIGNVISFIDLMACGCYPSDVVEESMELIEKPDYMDLDFFNNLQSSLFDTFVYFFEGIVDSEYPKYWCERFGHKDVYSDVLESIYDSFYEFFEVPKDINKTLINHILDELNQIIESEKD
jgi:hypothetical protein